MRLIFTFIVALPLITGLSYRDKLHDREQLEILRQRLQQENRAQLDGSMRVQFEGEATTLNPYGLPHSHIPCNSTMEGAIVMTIPEKCMNLVCSNNLVIPQYAYGETTCNCCEHNGKLYQDGETMSGACMKIFCCEGKWQTTGHIDDCCSHCDVYGDPHIKTFDARDDVNNFYNVHSYCNYSLTQKLEGNHTGHYSADFGVYAQFMQWLVHSSNIHMLTFTDNLHTVLEIDPFPLELRVNMDLVDLSTYDQPTPLVDHTGNKHPVLVWKQKYTNLTDDHNTGGNCIHILGSQGILIHACMNFVRIYAHPSLYENIGGLCGHFDQYDQNDHMDRGGVYHQLAYAPESASDAFVNSWTTDTNVLCTAEEEYNYCADDITETILLDITNQCTKLIMHRFEVESSVLSTNELNNLIQSCIHDMCSVGSFNEEISEHYLNMLLDQNYLAGMTTGADTVIAPPCNSTSQVSTVTETVTSTVVLTTILTTCSPSNSYTTLHTSYTTGRTTNRYTTYPTYPTHNGDPLKKKKIEEIKPTKAYNSQFTEV